MVYFEIWGVDDFPGAEGCGGPGEEDEEEKGVGKMTAGLIFECSGEDILAKHGERFGDHRRVLDRVLVLSKVSVLTHQRMWGPKVFNMCMCACVRGGGAGVGSGRSRL